MKRLIKEPLVHFLVLGAALFGLFAWVGGDEERTSSDEIVVTPGRIEHLSRMFEKTWRRTPSVTELDGLIRDDIREEILYREALALGLDRDDTIIRRRLSQKLEFLSEDLLALDPMEDDLVVFLKDHPERFRADARLTFQHVYLKPDQRGDALVADARKLLESLRSSQVEVEEAGDRFLLGSEFEALTEGEIAKTFGPKFVAPLLDAPLRQWFGPVPSGYGVHLIFIQDRTPGRVPEFDRIRNAVVREWSLEKRKEANAAFFKRLRERYIVTIEKPPPRAPVEIARTEEAE